MSTLSRKYEKRRTRRLKLELSMAIRESLNKFIGVPNREEVIDCVGNTIRSLLSNGEPSVLGVLLRDGEIESNGHTFTFKGIVSSNYRDLKDFSESTIHQQDRGENEHTQS